jgi:hypothetical protein
MPAGQMYPKLPQKTFHVENLNRRYFVAALFSKTGSFGVYKEGVHLGAFFNYYILTFFS